MSERGRLIIEALSESPWGAGLVNTDIGSDDRLAQHNLQIPAHASNRIVTPYLFPRNFPNTGRSRLTSSRPDATLITPYQAKTISSSPSSFCSHHALRRRHNPTQRTTTANRVRQPHQLSVIYRHGPGQQLEAAQRQHAELCKNISGKAVTLHTIMMILLGVGGTCCTEHTLNQCHQLGIDHQCTNKLARKFHAHSVLYANGLVTTRHAIELSHSQVLEPVLPVTLRILITRFTRFTRIRPSVKNCDC
eukprot:1161738-Pelagomonas_calceolata.AAC.6